MKFSKEYWYRQIDEVMNRFNFSKTYLVMEVLDWQWCDNGVPSVDEQRSTAQELLENIVEDALKGKKVEMIGCGGFVASINIKNGMLTLGFVAEEFATGE